MLGGESIAMGGDDAAEGSVEGKLAAVVEREGVKNTKVHKESGDTRCVVCTE